jgi:hypothetical protein
MGKKAREIENRILSELPPNKRLFKINAGMGWQGQVVKRESGLLILKNPRVLHAAPAHWPDLAGWTTVTCTQEMVGQKVAIFTGEEVKAGKDRLTQGQKKFGDLIRRMGGVFRVVKG